MTLPRSAASFERMVALGPVLGGFTDTECQVARAGYMVFTQGRPDRPWDYLTPHEQNRWLHGAALMCRFEQVTADELRDRVLALVERPSWATAEQGDRNRWSLVAGAMKTTQRRLAAAERMVVSG